MKTGNNFHSKTSLWDILRQNLPSAKSYLTSELVGQDIGLALRP
jgi:hypothetical protein